MGEPGEWASAAHGGLDAHPSGLGRWSADPHRLRCSERREKCGSCCLEASVFLSSASPPQPFLILSPLAISLAFDLPVLSREISRS